MRQNILVFALLFLGTIIKAQNCTALFTFGSTGLTIQFTDQSTHAANDPIVSWTWDFDDGPVSHLQNPTHTFPYPDHYDINLTVVTQSGCSDNVEIRIEICDFGVTYNIGTCNAQGMVPVTLNITDIFDNAIEITVTLDGQSVPGSPFEIDQDNPVSLDVQVAGNGLPHTIQIQSTDIETCGRTLTFTVEDCGSDCFLSGLTVQYAPGTTKNVSVNGNFFSPETTAIVLGDIVHFTWADGGHSTTSDATSGADAWNSGVIGQGSSFNINIHNPGTHNFYCIPHGGPNGVGMSGQILSNCPSGASMNLQVNFSTTEANAQGYNILWDNTPVAGSPFNYSGVGAQTKNISIAGDGLTHTLVVRDVADPTCDVDLQYAAPDCNQGGGNPVCGISGTVGNFGGCSNSNVTATLTVNISNGGSGFLVSIDNGPNTPHNYAGPVTNVTITLPGNGASHSVKITDNVDAACTATINVVTPNCNLPCSITNLVATAASGNGDPSGIVHDVNVQDFQFNPSVVNMTVGDIVRWHWTGAIAHTSTSDAASGANSWNSGLLNNGAIYNSPVLAQGTHPYYCIPHGAAGGVGMSGTIFVLPPCDANNATAVQITFNIASNGTQGFQVLVDGVLNGTFPYVSGPAQSASVQVTGDGNSHAILIRDVTNQSCSATTTVTTSDCNGGGNPVCTISVSAAVAGACSGNNVPVALTVTANNNSTTYSVTVDGSPSGTFNYNNPNVTVNVPGNGQSHTIVVTDSGDPACTATTSIVTPNCSLPCSVSNLTASVASGGQGGSIHTVNVEDFQFNPNVVNIAVGDVVQWHWTGAIAHTSTSDVTSGPDSWNSGLLNNGANFTSPVLTQGDHLYYCVPHGAPGGVGMAGTIHVSPACNEFGQATVQINFNITNGSAAGYSVLVDGNNAGNFQYVAGAAQATSVLVAGNGASHTIVVQDAGNGACNATVSVVTPNCGGGGNPQCSISLNPAITGGCNNNSVAVLLHVTGTNHATNYLVTLDGQPAGSFPYSNGGAQINVSGNGLAHTIVVTDEVDAACTASASITTPNCNLPCNLSIQSLNFGTPVMHTVSVQDFQFSPVQITINLGDTIQFNWTGVIPHTVTSDQPSGPNAFNSGLHGNGYSWQLIPNATGDAPYYCIPHGAPGGVGMAGIIHVTSSCNGSVANGSLQFTYSNTSGQGFVVTQDGTPVNGSPFPFVPGGQQTVTVSVNGDGATHTFVVADVANTSCSAQLVAAVPNCGQACNLDITQATVSACMGNTVTLSVSFTSNQPNATYNIYKDNIKLNPNPLTTDGSGLGSYSTMIVGNNSTGVILVQFTGNGPCQDVASVVIPSCGGPCLISNFVIGQNGSVHTVEVKDFEFSPAQIDVLIGDTVRFVWTGAIAHTSTSDAFSGPNSWSSGLLLQGATYDVIIDETGDFPYYCQPHGGPGGIGMSGAIHVLDTCSLDQWLTTLAFDVSAGSPLGYNVFVDGVKITTTPIQYDDPVGHNTEIVQLPGDGAWHLVTLQDMETGFCAYTQPVHTSICGAGCTVINLTANTGSNIVHEVEVRDFDYAPRDITVVAGERIHFTWTGQIPHTVTSDAVSGPEVFNSGLLGHGAQYDLYINTPGVHRYFCIPHGGPGGIGMSGSITVLPPCTDNTESVQVQFDVTHGSPLGYNLYVDGVLFGNNPRQYDNPLGSNEINLAHPADSATHIITIQDLNNAICAASDFFNTGSCNASCLISGLDYFLGNGRNHTVLVRDFDYEPKQLKIELGDTVHFVWMGTIPHTVTSDQATGPDVFNSGLLGQGSVYDVVISQNGIHPYYCIPHGAPGGFGMAGTIEVVDACDDGNVFVDFQFFSSGPGASYDVLNQGSAVLNDQAYQPGGIQHFTLQLPAQGQSHLIAVSDNGPEDCMETLPLDSFDCSDPCFLVRADFDIDINYSTITVAFINKSKGHISGWNWNFGDGATSTEQNPVHQYAQANLYNVCLTITDVNGCTEQFCDKLNLGSSVCNAGFTYVQDGLDVTFYNSSDVSSPQVAAQWSFGDGGTSSAYDSTTHSFALGIYQVCITVTSSGCTNTYCETVDLSDPCLALNADYAISLINGNSLHYQFNDLSSGPIGSHLWGFGDGQISTDANPDHQYANTGIYMVCLLIIDSDGNCTSSACHTVDVGTTGTDPEVTPLQKLVVVPNPVSTYAASIVLSGFEKNEIGSQATLRILDVAGRLIEVQSIRLQESQEISVPSSAGLYYIQVISGRKIYGAMCVVQ